MASPAAREYSTPFIADDEFRELVTDVDHVQDETELVDAQLESTDGDLFVGDPGMSTELAYSDADTSLVYEHYDLLEDDDHEDGEFDADNHEHYYEPADFDPESLLPDREVIELEDDFVGHTHDDFETSAADDQYTDGFEYSYEDSVDEELDEYADDRLDEGFIENETEGDAPQDIIDYVDQAAEEWTAVRKRYKNAAGARRHLLRDYRNTVSGTQARFKRANRRRKRKKRKLLAIPSIDVIGRAWLISRQNQLKFLSAPWASWRLANFTAPRGRNNLEATDIIGGSDTEKVAREMIDFVKAFKRLYPRNNDIYTYGKHGGGGFTGRGYSVDINLGGRDSRGFYEPDVALAALRALHQAAREVNVEWRAIYNDFSVADVINRETKGRRVIFVGNPNRFRNGVAKNINWHGPHPFLLHLHIDIVPGRQPGNSSRPSRARPGRGRRHGRQLIKFVQRLLNALEGEKLDDDGIVGRLTRGALDRFRQRYDVEGAGLDTRTLVALVQRSLEEMAQQSLFARIGELDPATDAAIRRFRSERGLSAGSEIDEGLLLELTTALGSGASRDLELLEGETARRESGRRSRYRWIQTLLNKSEGAMLDENGVYDAATRAAVRLFQKQFNIGVDGKVGLETTTAMIQRTLEILNNRSYSEYGKVTRQTRRDIGSFQFREKLPRTERFDRPTWERMRAVLSGKFVVPRIPPDPDEIFNFVDNLVFLSEKSSTEVRSKCGKRSGSACFGNLANPLLRMATDRLYDVKKALGKGDGVGAYQHWSGVAGIVEGAVDEFGNYIQVGPQLDASAAFETIEKDVFDSLFRDQLTAYEGGRDDFDRMTMRMTNTAELENALSVTLKLFEKVSSIDYDGSSVIPSAVGDAADTAETIRAYRVNLKAAYESVTLVKQLFSTADALSEWQRRRNDPRYANSILFRAKTWAELIDTSVSMCKQIMTASFAVQKAILKVRYAPGPELTQAMETLDKAKASVAKWFGVGAAIIGVVLSAIDLVEAIRERRPIALIAVSVIQLAHATASLAVAVYGAVGGGAGAAAAGVAGGALSILGVQIMLAGMVINMIGTLGGILKSIKLDQQATVTLRFFRAGQKLATASSRYFAANYGLYSAALADGDPDLNRRLYFYYKSIYDDAIANVQQSTSRIYVHVLNDQYKSQLGYWDKDIESKFPPEYRLQFGGIFDQNLINEILISVQEVVADNLHATGRINLWDYTQVILQVAKARALQKR